MAVCFGVVFSTVVPELAQAVAEANRRNANLFIGTSSRERACLPLASALKMWAGPDFENPHESAWRTIGSRTSIHVAYIRAEGWRPSAATSEGSTPARRESGVMSA